MNLCDTVSYIFMSIWLTGVSVPEAGQVSRGRGSVQRSIDTSAWERIRQNFWFVFFDLQLMFVLVLEPFMNLNEDVSCYCLTCLTRILFTVIIEWHLIILETADICL